MKFSKMIAGTTAAMSTIVLAGCGGGGSSEVIKAIFAEDAGTAAEALDDGKTLTAYNGQMSSSARRTDGVWASHASPEFSIKKNDQGGVDVTLGDEMVSFTPADLQFPDDPDQSDGWEKEDQDGNYRGVFAEGGMLGEVLSGNGDSDYHQVWAYFWRTEGGETFNGHAVVGTETKESALEGKANATYSGWASSDIYEKGSDSFDRRRVEGDVTMTANFDAGKISGTIDNLRTNERIDGQWVHDNWDDLPSLDGSMSMNETDIEGNQFSGSLTPDAALAASTGDFDGTYGGKFYGENGEEVGGVISIDEDAAIGTGFFTAEQDTP